MESLLKNIFGDDDDDDEEQIQPISSAVANSSSPSDEFEDVHTSILNIPMPAENTKLIFARLPATVSIQTKPYSRTQYEYEVDPDVLQKMPPTLREKRVQAGPHNIIRWRFKDQTIYEKDEEVDTQNMDFSSIDSNARLVEWSDGSLQIYIGDEPFDVSKQAVPNLHLYAHTSNFLVGSGLISQKFKMKPHSLNSKSTKNLVKNFGALAPTQQRRSTKVTLVDKDIEIEQDAKSQAAKILEKQKKTLQDSISKTKLTAAFLEEGEEEKPAKQRSSSSRTKSSSTTKRKRNNRRDEEEEFDEDNYSGEDEYQFGSGDEEEYNGGDSDDDLRKSKKKK